MFISLYAGLVDARWCGSSFAAECCTMVRVEGITGNVNGE